MFWLATVKGGESRSDAVGLCFFVIIGCTSVFLLESRSGGCRTLMNCVEGAALSERILLWKLTSASFLLSCGG